MTPLTIKLKLTGEAKDFILSERARTGLPITVLVTLSILNTSDFKGWKDRQAALESARLAAQAAVEKELAKELAARQKQEARDAAARQKQELAKELASRCRHNFDTEGGKYTCGACQREEDEARFGRYVPPRSACEHGVPWSMTCDNCVLIANQCKHGFDLRLSECGDCFAEEHPELCCEHGIAKGDPCVDCEFPTWRDSTSSA